MPHLATLISCPISSGSYTQMKASGADATTNPKIPCGEVECWFRNDSAVIINVVFNVTNATDAAAEATAFRYITVPASSTILIPYRLDPATTWVRSAGAATSSLFAIMKW
jgi:hypothetical protein